VHTAYTQSDWVTGLISSSFSMQCNWEYIGTVSQERAGLWLLNQPPPPLLLSYQQARQSKCDILSQFYRITVDLFR